MAFATLGVLSFKSPTNPNPSQTVTLQAGLTTSTLSTSGAQQPNGLLALFGNFSRMSASDVVTMMDEGQTIENFSYVVLGHIVVNSTDYYRVEFMQAPQNTTTILWFDPQGSVAVAEVLGDENYTGNFAALYSSTITSNLSLALLDSNDTQLQGLQKTGADVQQTIGGTQMTVSTYDLIPSSTSTIASETIRVATIPGSNFSLIVYLIQTPVDPTGSGLFFQVNSLSK
jgi:hypothetical protein